MPDIASISSILSSVKTATEIAKIIKNADLTLEKAEMKLKIADLISALADAKIATTEVQNIIDDKERQIKKLEDALELKSKLLRHEDAYYVINNNGNPSGDPYCSHCWEVEKKPVHLYFVPHYAICSHCQTKYSAWLVPINPEKEVEKNA